MDRYVKLIRNLPPLVSAVVWDVVNGHIAQSTVELAQAASKEEFDKYDIIRCVAAANLKYPPLGLAIELVNEMVETSFVAQ
jgi:hypothetical protein